jgi:hypothetical protein
MSKTLTIGATLIIGIEIDVEIEDQEAWTATFGALDLDSSSDCDEIAQKVMDRLRVTANRDGTLSVDTRDRGIAGVLINARHPRWGAPEFESVEVAGFEGSFSGGTPDSGDDEENDGPDPDPSEDPT